MHIGPGVFARPITAEGRDDLCFLCGTELVDGIRSDEHVIPRRIQKAYKLYDQPLRLLNNTTIKYSALTIPCCRPCNGGLLEPVEHRVLDAIEQGKAAVDALDPWDTFLWLGKVYYGLLYRETFLQKYRDTRRGSGPIATEEMLQRLQVHHLLLQRVRGVVEVPEYPASVFTFECQEPTNRADRWDYGDNFLQPFLAIRCGKVGFVALLQDWGAATQLQESPFEGAAGLRLHPQQFKYLMARGVDLALSFTRTPKHLFIWSDDEFTVVTPPIAGLSSRPLFEPGPRDRLAWMIARFLGQPVETVYDGENVVNPLLDEDGRPNFVPVSMPNPGFCLPGHAPS